MDQRHIKLANLLVTHSLGLKKSEKVLIDLTDVPDSLAIALLQAVRAKKAQPFIEIKHSRVVREFIKGSSEEQAKSFSKIELARMKQMQAYIAVRGSNNASENSDIPAKVLSTYSKIMRPVLNHRVNKTRWVVLRWPTASMAQSANMSTEAFEDFYFKVCTLNYQKMAAAMQPLVKLLNKTDKVRITGPGTDLQFSIKGIPAIACSGTHNIPDGEVFTCPVKNSVQGVIKYNTASTYLGNRFENVELEFKDGKIIRANASDKKKINQILDTDAGARFIGEFAIGVNPYILDPMSDILFDEKIAGSIHFTPGQAYEVADNGNRSAVHWDLVLIQRQEYGGGEMYFDGKLVRQNGLFVTPELKGLNPKALI
jgi:aminopeptidase